MAQYIDKAAVVAEIEKRYNECLKRAKIVDADYWNGKADAYRNMLVLLDTIEVKEVDFESEWKKYFEYKGEVATVNVKQLAKHFFELGLAQKGD